MGHPFSGHRCGPDNGNYGRLVLLLPVSACSQSGGWGNWSCVVLSPWASAPAGTQPRLFPGHSQHSSEGTGPSPALWTMEGLVGCKARAPSTLTAQVW